MTTEQIIDHIYQLPLHSKSALLSRAGEVSYQKGKILLRAHRVEEKLYFIKKGIVRALANQGDEELTFWFGKEGEAILSMKSYVSNSQGYESIELLEDCELLEFRIAELRHLYTNDIELANWGRIFAEKELLKTEERLISRQCRSATERYKELLRDHPDLLQRVSLRYIASYLGMSQVSLSRIRADVRSGA